MLNGIAVIKGIMHSLKKTEEFIAIPYYSWAHRGKYDMSVWIIRGKKDSIDCSK